MTRMRGPFRGALFLALALGAGSVQAQTAPTTPVLNLPFPGSIVPTGTLGIANAGGLGFSGALPTGGINAIDGTIRTGGLTNPGGLSFGGGGGFRGLAAIPGTSLTTNSTASLTSGSIGGTGTGTGTGAGISGTGLTSDLDTGLTTGAIGGAGIGAGAGIGTRSGVLDPNRLTPGIGTSGAGGAPAGAGTAGAPSAVDAYTDPFNGRGMP